MTAPVTLTQQANAPKERERVLRARTEAPAELGMCKNQARSDRAFFVFKTQVLFL